VARSPEARPVAAVHLDESISMKLMCIAASLTTMLALTCSERSAKPSAKIDTPVARTQAPAPEAKPADSAVLPAPGAAARNENQPEPKAPPPQVEAPFVPPQNYTEFLDGLLPAISAPDVADRERVQRQLERACVHASAPGNESRRTELCQAMVARLGPETAPAARAYLLRRLERIGNADCVPALSKLLDDRDPQVREAARRAVQNIPGPAAGLALEEALRKTGEPAWRVALINALAARREQSALRAVSAYTEAEQPEVALAAIAALGDMGGMAQVFALQAVMAEADTVRKAAAAEALLRIMDRLTAAGEGRAAMPVLWQMTGDASLPVCVRGAALRVLVSADPTQAKPHVLRALADDQTPELRPVAARLLAQIPDQDVIFTIVMTLDTLPADVQCVLLDVLADRGGKGKLPVLAALDSKEEVVRVAAVKALQKLGDVSDIPRLARLAALNEGSIRDAARSTLQRLRGFNIDPALMVELDRQKEPGIRAEITRALAGRHFKLAVPRLLALASEPSPVLRAAVYEALGQLAGADATAELIGFLMADQDEDAAAAADDAIVELAQRDEDRDRRAAPLLAALKGASGAASGRLLHVLGRLQGPAALAAVRAALKSYDGASADAAFRALADWGDAAVLDDLIQFAGSENETRHALALRGYVRLVRLPSDRPAEQTLEMLKRAMSLARGPDEQKLVLAGLGDVPNPAALEEIQTCLRDAGLRDEAAAAMVSVARRIAPRCPEDAKAALEKVVAAGAAEAPTNQARDALKAIQDHAGTIGVWEISGPYSVEGKGFADVFACEFEPETGGNSGTKSGATWKPLTATRSDDPWIFDLRKVDKGTNCCAYARTGVWSDKERPARLELGSDDGVKVWLNGQLVHSNSASRGVTPGEDKVEIKLQRGWNSLLLKIVQSSGNWGFACAVRDPAGQPIPDLKFNANR
jgi:HEAT repeat protein